MGRVDASPWWRPSSSTRGCGRVWCRDPASTRSWAAGGRGLTLVSAPAGFGKTTLLAAWLAGAAAGEAGTRRIAWVSLDEADTSAAAFWAYVLTALERAAPGAGAEGLALLEAGQPVESVLATVLNELSVLPDDVDLVLDDYHLAESPEIQPGVAFLLEHLPPQVHLVISTRADPALPLARLRARGELTEVRAADLRFTHEEATAYLADATGLAAGPARRRGPGGPDRGLDRVPAARRDLAARPGRPVPVHRGVRRRRPVRRGLPRRGGPGPPARGGPRLPARDGHPGAAHRPALRRRHRDVRERPDAGVAGTPEPVRGASGRPAPLVPLPPPVRRRPPGAPARRAHPTGSPGCTGAPATGTTRPGSPNPRSGTRSPPATSRARQSWPSWRSRRWPGYAVRRCSGAGSTPFRTRCSGTDRSWPSAWSAA